MGRGVLLALWMVWYGCRETIQMGREGLTEEDYLWFPPPRYRARSSHNQPVLYAAT